LIIFWRDQILFHKDLLKIPKSIKLKPIVKNKNVGVKFPDRGIPPSVEGKELLIAGVGVKVGVGTSVGVTVGVGVKVGVGAKVAEAEEVKEGVFSSPAARTTNE
jgi:hypothetical protein